jgi:pimeloyl-ACP methyl ester carboxylesterase
MLETQHSGTGQQQRVVIAGARARVGSYVARDGGQRPLELAYDVFGEHGRPLVLVTGIGAQRIFWDDSFCERFVDAGFRVLRFDHRDTGESTHLDAAALRPFPLLARRALGAPVPAPYSLSSMASDVVGLCDALGWRDVHVLGASLGGMVGQHLALEHASRVRSLTLIMTSTGAMRFAPRPHALRALLARAPRTAEQAGERVVSLFARIGSPAWPIDAARLRALGAAAFTRGNNPRGFLRQFAAVLASGDRGPALGTIQAPTLVIHGSRDPMLPLAAGRALAHAVADGTWLPIAGMGHDLPAPLWPMFVAAVARHAARADARAV